MKKSEEDLYIDITSGDFFPILEAIDQGILMADKHGSILYYNKTHAKMDGLDYKNVIGRKMVDVYDLDENSSTIMRCLKHNKAIINYNHIYTARNGRVVNSINSNYPIRKNGQLVGAVCFVKDYEYLDGIIKKVDGSYKKVPIQNETRFTFKSIIGSTRPMIEILNKAKLASNSPSPIMLYGETGTGKELFAQAIHNFSFRKPASYMAVNCAAIPETLLEGILFGSTKGAYTGAMEKPGLLEQANGGTVFLDEINSMPIGLQAKLLRVVQEKKVRRLGASKEIVLDLKIISSTNEIPQKVIAGGSLRKDLFYRLGVVFLAIPPLRDRRGDMDALTDFFIKKHNRTLNKKVRGVSAELKKHFQVYAWPGNVRELENLIEGAMNMVGNSRLVQRRHIASELIFSEETEDLFIQEKTRILPGKIGREKTTGEISLNSKDICAVGAVKNGMEDDTREKEMIVRALINCLGNVKKTSEKLNIARQTLHKKIKKHGIDRDKILEDLEKNKIEKSLSDAGGNITLAARNLSISRQLLNYKIKKYAIVKESFRKNMS
ncbi:MAG: sigma 54-interacting transcriptional regulator [Desulfotignum sp.]|nr:sigma 54-interacting transcriptional regulator [Desulfotignum sp.]MCF8088204.1 sigma 54-interacting transcriptional regulator [Desulfotignum sp.]MCF8136013.1 sigma 54-interacting transcriptional regulator [Desulfotignum sp.]